MKQFLAGYIMDGLLEVSGRKTAKRDVIIRLAEWASRFDVMTKTGFEDSGEPSASLYAVLTNLLQRGVPTRLNQYALEKLVERSSFLGFRRNSSVVEVKWKNSGSEVAETIFRSLHLIEPRLTRDQLERRSAAAVVKPDSTYEERFLFRDLPGIIGESGDFIIQLLALQRPVESITGDAQGGMDFKEQRTDFSIEFPYYKEKQPVGMVVEIDGGHHRNTGQMAQDTRRDKAVVGAGWGNTLRVKAGEFHKPGLEDKVKKLLLPSLKNQFIATTYRNYRAPLWRDADMRDVFEITLIPFAIARFQRMLVEMLMRGCLVLDAKTWNIAVIERDVPFARIALDDFRMLLAHLQQLMGGNPVFPEIGLDVFHSAEFSDSRYQFATSQLVDGFDYTKDYDVVFDIALLERSSFMKNIDTVAGEVVTVRSIHFPDCGRRVYTGDLLDYNSLPVVLHGENEVPDDGRREHLEYVLRSVFRKRTFREGQLPIIGRALRLKSVIGLLPTGGGKSITYQLSALLQPGICIVVDPIRSLMKDQVDGLRKNAIDNCVYINSTLQGKEKQEVMQRVAGGQAQFVFISPERLQMEDFRALLWQMREQGIYFSYCVIDEAHCVSEWGHDFRTAYLRLGQNAMRFCKACNVETLPLLGLTATASYDVLADVQRELSGNDEAKKLDEDAVVRAEYTKRPELQYCVEEVVFPQQKAATVWRVAELLGHEKQNRMMQLLEEAPRTLFRMQNDPMAVFSPAEWETDGGREKEAFEQMRIEKYDPEKFYGAANAGLVFCPHTKGIFGVTDKFTGDRPGRQSPAHGYFDALSGVEGIKAGYFMGSGDDRGSETQQAVQVGSFENQDRFIRNEINLMVATKAFGMGIDKENIRYTVHVNYPGSIESYVQEAGRAGRDRKIALSYILFNDQSVVLDGEYYEHDLDVNLYFHKNAFKGVGKELAVLDELLTEIHFPDRTFEIERAVMSRLGIEVRCNYWEKETDRKLYIQLADGKTLGNIDLETLQGNSRGTTDHRLSTAVFSTITGYICALNLTEPVYRWVQRGDKQTGLEGILSAKQAGDAFSVTIGFDNNGAERVKTITKWLHEVVHRGFNEQLVHRMRATCTDARAFIEEVRICYRKFTGELLDFEQCCGERDLLKGNLPGTAYHRFMFLYDGYRNKQDTEKAIYRLSTVGLIDDYTVNFTAKTFTLNGRKKEAAAYEQNLRNYLLKYYSGKTTDLRLAELSRVEGETPVRRCLVFLVRFVYKEIQKKRELAIQDMKMACRLGLEQGGVAMKEYIDLYFNSKYARSGYTYMAETGQEVNASLPDLTNEGKEDDLKWVWRFMEIVDEDPKAGQIDNIKHLRGACTRMLRNQPDSYTLLFLSSFSLYMLEYKNRRFLAEAAHLLETAFVRLQEKEPGLGEPEMERIFRLFVDHLLEKNIELGRYLAEYGMAFDFETILLQLLMKPLKKAADVLHALNRTLGS